MALDAPLPLSLFAWGTPEVRCNATVVREVLDDRCWVDRGSGWLGGGDELLGELAEALPWNQGRRLMWGNWVDEPRLTSGAGLHLPNAPTVLRSMACALSERYGVEFDSCFCNYYRGGSDSVAWHADRDGRTQIDPLVAIVSLGGPRQFAMRPKDPLVRRGTRARLWTLHSGDLLVMGGSCQHEWEHSIPKVRHAPPRMSVTFRHRPRSTG
jgi:alkylated DNA repair dioxygenase AlkB